MENSQDYQPKRGFGVGSVLAIAALVGILGFGLGANFDTLSFGQLETQNEELPEDLNYKSVEQLYDVLRRNYAGDLTLQGVQNGLKSGLVEATGDPFSEYLTPAEAKNLQQSLEGEFSGIGAEIGIRNDQLVVIAPLDGTPADEAGLRSGDIIAAINGEETSRMSIQDAVTKIRGEAGTDVTLTILRPQSAPQEITITRGVIEIPSVRSELLEGNIGYIELIQFGSDSAQEFHKAAVRLKQQGAEKIILDVRNNPGGFLDVAVSITSEFLEAGELVVEERRDGEVIEKELAQAGGVLIGIPTVVLINEGSASASEIIAGALRDQGVATLVGTQTFGKGSVQQLIELDAGGVLRVTIANWYTPSGNSISEEGITPDVTVKRTDEDFANDRDPQLQKAIEILQDG